MKTVYFDVDTQLDFMVPGGALYVPGAECRIPRIAQLNRQAAVEGSLVIATMDAHLEDDPEFRVWPHHCVAGCWGQRKALDTVLEKTVRIPNHSWQGEWRGAQQLLLEKQTVDCFSNPNLVEILRAWNAGRYIVYGVVTEICVKHAVEGLTLLGKPVEVVHSAVQCLNAGMADQFLQSVRITL